MTPTPSRTLPLVVVITLFVATGVVAQPQPIDLGTLGGSSSSPAAINESGQVVGSFNGHAFVWTTTTGMVDLGTSTPSFATAINSLGHVGGGARPANPLFGSIHPFLWTPGGGIVDLEPPNVSLGLGSGVSALNDVDQVVGTLDNPLRYGAGVHMDVHGRHATAWFAGRAQLRRGCEQQRTRRGDRLFGPAPLRV